MRLVFLPVFVVFGITIGALARLIVPDNGPGGWVGSMLAGVIGANIGGIGGYALGLPPISRSTIGWFVALLGAIAGAYVYHAAFARRARTG